MQDSPWDSPTVASALSWKTSSAYSKQACTSQRSDAAGSEGIQSATGFDLKGQPGSGSWTGSRTHSALLALTDPLHTINEAFLCVAGAAEAAQGHVGLHCGSVVVFLCCSKSLGVDKEGNIKPATASPTIPDFIAKGTRRYFCSFSIRSLRRK